MPELSANDALLSDAPHWIPSGAIPRAVRDGGRYFYCDDWWPGDVLLTRPAVDGAVSRGIVAFQKKAGYDDADAQWSHTAIYLGDGLTVCEATRSGVITSPLFNYCVGHIVRLRRSKHIRVREDGWQLAMQAVRKLSHAYGFREIYRMLRLVSDKRGFWLPVAGFLPAARRGIICSSLYADAHSYVTGITIGEKTNGTCVPAFLSQCTDMIDQPIRWARIVSP